MVLRIFFFLIFSTLISFSIFSDNPRVRSNFNNDWKFALKDSVDFKNTSYNEKGWRSLNLPHDWSIEGEFSKNHPATAGGGALPGGTGWYRKKFDISERDKTKEIFIEFDGVYCNSEVWINGHYLGKRPNGYISFRYDLTPFLITGKNVIAVRVDNSSQPNSRWYSGSGIYRNVWLTSVNKVFVDQWGTFITTPEVNSKQAKVKIETKIRSKANKDTRITLSTLIYTQAGKQVAAKKSNGIILTDSSASFVQDVNISNPQLWSVEKPTLYKVITKVEYDGAEKDIYETSIGLRYFNFDSQQGFSLNGEPIKILGVCNHHDLGCLGAAINKRALQRQLEILKEMGCNGIRTSHNPPAPELLELCDQMGFIVMNEAFDMWKKEKSPYDYHLAWNEWHKKDLQDLIKRDRNHPSVFIWSIGNEIGEQWDSTGTTIARELASIVKDLDDTRPITSACNDPKPHNNILKSGVIDLIGFNYNHKEYIDFHKNFPDKKFIATETTSALATRGEYDMPSDSIKRWPIAWDKPFLEGNEDYTCSAYDNCSTPWGSTHEETWKIMKKNPFLSGMYVWTGFDYLGEPTPYTWPAKSSYFGIVDLAGFPKDSYYMYQSEWTTKPVLHIFPHWNWAEGELIDVWAYSNAEEVELFLNGKSLGIRKKQGDDLHLSWGVTYTPGTLRAVSRSKGKVVLTKEMKTAGVPVKIIATADQNEIAGDGNDLSFVNISIVDKDGILVPNAIDLINFKVEGSGDLAGVDNGNPIDHDSFKESYRRAFHGKCLAVIKSKPEKGKVILKATAQGLEAGEVIINIK